MTNEVKRESAEAVQLQRRFVPMAFPTPLRYGDLDPQSKGRLGPGVSKDIVAG